MKPLSLLFLSSLTLVGGGANNTPSNTSVPGVETSAGTSTLVIGLKWRDFLLFCFDYQQAQASGLCTRGLHYGLLCMVSLTIVATLKAVGIPMLVSASGVCLSFFLGSAPAPTIVVLFALAFIVTFIVTSANVRRRECVTTS